MRAYHLKKEHLCRSEKRRVGKECRSPKNICEKEWIWVNVLVQIFISAFVFIVKHIAYKTKRIRNIVYDKDNRLIPIIDKRFTMFAWETAMLFVTTEQGYLFALIDIIEGRMCDDIVTAIFLFWLIILIIEFRYDLRVLKKDTDNAPKKEHKKRA